MNLVWPSGIRSTLILFNSKTSCLGILFSTRHSFTYFLLALIPPTSMSIEEVSLHHEKLDPHRRIRPCIVQPQIRSWAWTTWWSCLPPPPACVVYVSRKSIGIGSMMNHTATSRDCGRVDDLDLLQLLASIRRHLRLKTVWNLSVRVDARSLHIFTEKYTN
jgi:hypothetical protein